MAQMNDAGVWLESVRKNITISGLLFKRAEAIMEHCAFADFSELVSSLIREKYDALGLGQPPAAATQTEIEEMREAVKSLVAQAEQHRKARRHE